MEERINQVKRVPVVLHIREDMWEGIKDVATKLGLKPQTLLYKMFLVGYHHIRLTHIVKIKKDVM